jgi:L-rhamnose-H+ transport protein
MESFTGILIVILAGIFQGSFILPMTLVKRWKWENTWLVFSFAGMIVLNFLLAGIFISEISQVYATIPGRDLAMLALFGFGWGIGAVLFGIGMDKLGMALGYPIIMGLTASMGALLPLFILHSADILKPSGLMLITGVVIAVAGIILCSKAANLKAGNTLEKGAKDRLTGGIIIAVAAGLLSSLPNIGFTLGSAIAQAATDNGTSHAMAGNAVWALFFSIGFIPNLAYTIFLMLKNKTLGLMISAFNIRNAGLGLLMSVLWIGSFYLYGYSSYNLGNLGNIVGWPLFISLSIVVGNLWGIWRGEWRDSSAKAKTKLNTGLVVLVVAMILFGISNLF